ncbi:MAG TPA: hypothetical protein VMC09_14695 [Anaerolineales bacterium]|nr:hypothetical protein [Anaerolineales bacterium]
MLPYAVSIKYMIGGYIVIFAILFGYLISLFVRWRKLRQDLRTLEEMQKRQ